MKDDMEINPLHHSAGTAHVAVVLSKLGVHIQREEAVGATPLHLAAENGHVAVAKALAELGAFK
jgi:ankyrin repeat protein